MGNSVLWTKPSNTCLGDRLLDTMILATYAKLLDADLYFPWVDCPFTVVGDVNPTYSSKEGETKEWDKVRFDDYKFENYTQYFNLPKNIKINEVVDNPTHLFHSILGGCTSPLLFHKLYMSNICSVENFEMTFREIMSEFTPKDKLLSLVKDRPKPDVSVHLRRTDKINTHGDYSTFMTHDGLDHLNQITHDVVNKLYDGKKSFYFSSDDVGERDRYHMAFPNHIEHYVECSSMEKTYIDLYTLSISDYIILSQVHSNFSIFASYINKAKLVYLYDHCLIVDREFKLSDNFIHYNQL